ncbi:hypothetical protein CU097_013013 [Rhizopus azygosporus]|uniref:Uncharacterized protein n=1 Tax=Rhizopus azygosporus TaxID=86630 RepID=A0A367K4X1_RHIAZ|nr:hypothetical protein CU097_013013 [Rhizopus azygosporus]
MDPQGQFNGAIVSAAPVWTVVVISILAIMLIVFITIFVRRFIRRSRMSNRNFNKKPSVESLETLVTAHQQKQQSKQLAKIDTHDTEKPTRSSSPMQPTNSATLARPEPQEEELEDGPPEPLQEIKISLPLPPPSTSFFADKMELDGSNCDLYDLYVHGKTDGMKRQSMHSVFISIDLDSISNAASNIQRKASTIRRSLYQSIRKPTSASGIKAVPAQKMFTDGTKEYSRQSIVAVNNERTQIGMPKASKIPQIEDVQQDEEPTAAAKRVIRSASKKAKSRSMVIHPDLPDDVVTPPKQETSKYATVRSIRSPDANEHVTISSGSVRRFMRQNSLFQGEDLPPESDPLPGTLSKNDRKPVANALDISKWWEGGESSNGVPEIRTNGMKNSESSLSVSQYRASLNDSVFALNGTISKGTGALFVPEPDKSKSDGAVSRNNSAKRGTLGRNTLKTLTANATQGVNKSIRGLFDQSSSLTNINKVSPSDSQKMEIDVEHGLSQQPIAPVESQNSRRKSYSHRLVPESPSKSRLTNTRHSIDESSQKVEADDIILKQSRSFSSKQGVEPAAQGVSYHKETIHSTQVSNTDHETDVAYIQQLGANKFISPRQTLLTKSLLAQQAKRSSSTSRPQDEPLQAPDPVVSFSSSTVRTVIPDDEMDHIQIRQNPMNQQQRLSIGMNGSNKVLASSFGDESSFLADRFSSMNAEQSRDHSRQSSGGTSVTTAVRISGGYPSSTWNGRAQKNGASRLSVIQTMDTEKESDIVEDKRGFFSTMRKDKKNRGVIPWMASEKMMTPAEMERDRYLNGSR